MTRYVWCMTPFDPRDPRSFAFYQMFIAGNDRRTPKPAGCGELGGGCLLLIAALWLLIILAKCSS
ncbi:MAG: hypothetical protein ACXVAM_18900 [Vulcanimicrobiaceae bacterium]